MAGKRARRVGEGAEPLRKAKTSSGNRRVDAPVLSDKSVDGILCPSCGRKYTDILPNYYGTHSKFYSYTNSIPICKECLKNLFEEYTQRLGDPLEALRYVCGAVDSYFSRDLAEKTRGDNWLNTYFIANARNNSTKSYLDTLLEERAAAQAVYSMPEMDSDVKPETIRRFGLGYSTEQYQWLQSEYSDWCRKYEIAGDKPLEILIANIVRTELEISEAPQTGADVNKLTTRLNTLLGSANLKPVQSNSEANEIYPFGVEIQKFEEECPIEPDPEMEDVDGILRYLQIFSGHIAKMFGKPNRYSHIYEEEMAKYTVSPPEYEYEEESGSESLFGDND